MADKIYIEKINDTIRYIRENLDRQLSPEDISKVSGFSRFHVHRIFRVFTGETLYEAILRLKIEKAAQTLTGKPSVTVGKLAALCGFESATEFSTEFRKRFSMSPSMWKKLGPEAATEASALTGAAAPESTEEESVEPVSSEVKTIEDIPVAYIKHSRVYAGDTSLFIYLYNKLAAWAASEDLLIPENQNIVVYHEPTEITRDDRSRISLGLSVHKKIRTGGDIGSTTLPGGEYLICRFELKEHQFQAAWDRIYRRILPDLGLEPDDGVGFELYPNDSGSDRYSSIVDLCIPVRHWKN